ncbi:MAG TPA: TIGR03936 family radical SAM-associated protein [Streptosporangiaceae bacterium]
MARPVPSGPPPAPTVQRLTIRYAKRGRMRFASHRDVARAIERGVRKAGLPVAYSAGFSPHPRISYSGGAPTGAASEAEYLEIAVTSQCEPAEVCRRLDAALPDGIDVIEVVEAAGKSGEAQLGASEWEVIWPGVPASAAASAVRKFLALPSVEVERLTSKGTRTLDARAAVLSLVSGPSAEFDRVAAERQDGQGPGDAVPAPGCAILRMIVRQLTPAVRPDDILAALRQLSAFEPASPPLVTRLWQGPLSSLTAAQTGAQPGMTAACDATGPVRPENQAAGASPSPVPGSGYPGAASQRQAAEGLASGDRIEGLPDQWPHRPGEGPRREAGPQGPRREAGPRHEEHLPSSTTDKAMQQEAKSAVPAPATQLRANEQLPRGTLGQLADLRAREPYGRDCPDARNRATESTVRTQ